MCLPVRELKHWSSALWAGMLTTAPEKTVLSINYSTLIITQMKLWAACQISQGIRIWKISIIAGDIVTVYAALTSICNLQKSHYVNFKATTFTNTIKAGWWIFRVNKRIIFLSYSLRFKMPKYTLQKLLQWFLVYFAWYFCKLTEAEIVFIHVYMP